MCLLDSDAKEEEDDAEDGKRQVFAPVRYLTPA